VITLHHLERSRSHRVLWLLEELELPYEIVRYERDPETMLAPPALTKVHPLGKSPVITDDDHTIAESAAILEYLVERHGQGRLVPKPGTPAHLRYRYFMHYAEGSLMPPLLVRLLCNRVRAAPLPFFLKPVANRIAERVDGQYTMPNLQRHAAFLDAELADRKWFAGDELTVADIQLSYPVEALVQRVSDLATDRLRDFTARIHERPAYRRAVDKGGPFEPT
jgi:glutathione S-transferase